MDTVGEKSVKSGIHDIGNLYEGREADLGRGNMFLWGNVDWQSTKNSGIFCIIITLFRFSKLERRKNQPSTVA